VSLPPPHTYTHLGTSVVPVLQKYPEMAGGGGGGLQYDILEILNFVGFFFLIIVGQTFSNIKYSEHLKRVCNTRFLYRFL
jgi:hypothetical protein